MAVTYRPLTRPEAARPPLLPSAPASDTAARWETLALRIGFLTTGSFILFQAWQAWAAGRVVSHPEVVGLVFALYALAFLLLGLGALQIQHLSRYRLVLPVAVVACLGMAFYVQIQVANRFYGTDTLAFTHVAVEKLLDGENPYSVRDEVTLLQASERFGIPEDFITRRTDGTTIPSLMSWPAGDVLIFVPPYVLGLRDLRWVVVGAELLVLVILWWKAPRALQPLVFLPLAADNLQAVLFTSGGTTDFLWVAPLLGTALSLRSRNILAAGLFFGAAAAIKQQPWILAPFLLIWIWNDDTRLPLAERGRCCVTFAGAAAAVFFMSNLPFAVWDFNGWVTGTFAPFQEGLIPWGSGLSLLTQLGIAQLPKAFYSLALFGVWGFLVLAYAQNFRAMKHMVWLLPAVVLWFSYRSLHNYFMNWSPLLLAGLFSWWEEGEREAHVRTD